MNRHAKAPSAFTPGRSAALALALGAIALLAFAPLALASKGGDSFIGTVGPTSDSSTSGGQFRGPRDIAVHQDTGQIYVPDRNNARIQRFSSAGTFELAWGVDVVTGGATGTGTLTNGSTSITSVVTTSKAFIVGQVITGTGIPAGTKIVTVGSGTITLSQAATASGAGTALTVATGADNVPTDEVQTVTVTATGGNFKLAYTTPNPSPTSAGANTTANIPFNASAAEVQTALEGLGNIGAGNVSVTSPNPTGGPYTVTFQGTRFADTNVNQMTAPAGSPGLTGGTATVSTFREGSRVFERCTVAVDCKAGVATGGNPNDKLANGALGSQLGLNGIAIDEDTGNVYATDTGNGRVNTYDADGVFIRSFGFDVVAPGEPSEAFTLQSEIQRVAIAGIFGEPIISGQFRLKFDGQETADIAHNANGAAIESALVALSNVGPGDVAVSGGTGGPWTIDFAGALANANVPKLEVNPGTLDGGLFGPGIVNASVQVLQEGGAVPAFEVCPAAERCKAGTAGSAPGQFGSATGTGRLAVSPPDGSAASGFLYVRDMGSNNKRMQKFNLDGSLAPSPVIPVDPAALGHVAVDANGIVYIDAGTSIGRYDPAANGGAGTFLAPFSLAPLPPGGIPSIFEGGMEIDPTNGHLLVVVSGTTPDTAIQEYADPAGAEPELVDVHMQSGTGDQAIHGLGLIHNGSADRLYVSSNTGAIDDRILVLDNDGGGTPPSLTVTPPTNVGHNQATFHGTVNPNGPTGFATSYRFEYSKNGVSWVPANATTLVGDDAVSHSVSNTATGLEANTFYRVRLLTTRAFNAGSTTSAELTFITDAVTPEIVRQDVQGFTDTEATLSASVNPNGKPTSYQFEYGKTTAYGSKVPVPDGSLTGTFAKYVTETISGLEPNTTYHYRLVANNEEGTSNGADQTFTTRPALDPLPGRAYEQVSAVEKNGYNIERSSSPFAQMPVSPDGSSAMYGSQGAFGGAEFGSAQASGTLYYQARRGADGWTTRPMIPRSTNGDADVTANVDALQGDSGIAAVVSVGNSIDDGPNPLGGLYRHEVFSGALTPLVKAIEPGSGFGRPSFIGGSADLSRMVFSSIEVLTGDAGIPAAGTKLYEVVDGEVRLVSFNTANAPFSTAVSSRGEGGRNAVSRDASHVFFSTPTSGNAVQIYRRSDSTTTKLVSPSKRTPTDPSGAKAKEFVSATPDQGPGDPAMVFFTSSEHLTNNANTGPSRAGKDLYRYDVNADSLVDVSAESNTANGARVQGVIGHSDDGKWVYYVGLGQVLAGKGVDGQPNVYLWHDDGTAGGTTKLIGTLAPGACGAADGGFALADGCNYLAPSSSNGPQVSRVSADGQSLLFQSTRPLTGHQNNGLTQVFIYEADANGGAGQISCLSCRHGFAPQGNSVLPDSGGAVSEGERSRALSQDGSRAFFNSDDALLPADTNGRWDVYEWDDGRIRLISTGKETSDDTAFSGASRSGDDVFFITRERLVGQDREKLFDLYDARVGGGIAEQFPPVPGEPCTGEACKPAVSSEPQATTPQSASSTGTGNVREKPPAKKCGKNRVKRRGKCVRKASKKSKAKAKRANKSGRAGK